MSLVNQMLMDLDDRHVNEYCDGVERPSDDYRSNSKKGAAFPVLILFVIILAVGVVGLPRFSSAFLQYISVFQQTSPPSALDIATPAPKKTTAITNDINVAPPVENVQQLEMKNSAGDNNTAITYSSEITNSYSIAKSMTEPEQRLVAAVEEQLSSPDRTQEIVALLDEARDAMTRDRLTTPAGDNALDRFKTVLSLEPNHSEAQAGIAAIAARYWEMYEVTTNDGRTTTARAYREKATAIAGDYPFVEALTGSFEEVLGEGYQYGESQLVGQYQSEPVSEPAPGILSRVQTLIKDERYDDAILLIQDSGDSVLAERSILKLYAALLHQQKQFLMAAAVYRDLIAIESGDAQYWLGYATSLDAAGSYALALGAYQQTQRLLTNRDSAMPLVNERISVLHHAQLANGFQSDTGQGVYE